MRNCETIQTWCILIVSNKEKQIDKTSQDKYFMYIHLKLINIQTNMEDSNKRQSCTELQTKETKSQQ